MTIGLSDSTTDYSAYAAHAKKTIGGWVDAAIPKLYHDVHPMPDGSDPDFVQRAMVLDERLSRCADPDDAVRLAGVAANLLLTQRGAVVFITGATGVGKSSLAALIVRTMVEFVTLNDWNANPLTSDGGLFHDPNGVGMWRSQGVMWTSAFELFDAERCGSPSDLMRDLKRVPLAVLDDIGDEGTDGRVKSTEAVVKARDAGLRSSIFISNYVDPEAPRSSGWHDYFRPLAQRYEPGVVRRLTAQGRASYMHIHVPKKH